MKSILKYASFILVLTFASTLFAQEKSKRDLDNYRQPDKRGINVFEAPKDTVSTFEDIRVRIGGSSTLQSHDAASKRIHRSTVELEHSI